MRFTTKLCLFLFFTAAIAPIRAQETRLRVIRSNAVDRNVPIKNIFVDEENVKWVTNEKGVYRVHAVDLASPVKNDGDEHSLLHYPDANFKLEVAGQQLQAILGDALKDDYVSTAYYDEERKELWIGTSRSGVFRLKSEPQLQLLEHFDNKNSKLRSNTINTIYRDRMRRYWIGTDEGVLIGRDDKWELMERYFRIQKIIGYSASIWVLSDNEIWEADRKDELYALELDPAIREGTIQDIEFDQEGNLWIASEIITLYDRETRDYQSFGPAQEFTSQFVNCIAVDHDGALWIGTEDKGLYLIQEESAMTVTCLIEKELSCEGSGADAALSLKVSGGEEPFSYKWENGLQGDKPGNLGPGIYRVTVTDSQGKEQVAEAEIADPRIRLNAIQEKEASAEDGGDAVATVSVEGGASNYTFLWDNGETTQTARQLTEGQHSVTVTAENGCSSVASLNISRRLAALGLAINQTVDIKCAGEQGAALEVQVNGGKPPYQFEWSDPALSGQAPTGLKAGAYQVTVTDATGQTFNSEVIVNAPEELSAVITPVAPASTGNADGQATVAATGGSAPYLFSWDNGETAENAIALAPGTRTVTVTDANGCTSAATLEVSENILPLTASIEQKKDIQCAGNSEAALQVQVTGGKGPYQFQWNDPALTGQAPVDVPAGTYTVSILDEAGNNVTAEIEVPDAVPLAVTITPVAPASTGNADGQATVAVTGGAAPYSFVWDNGETAENAVALAPGNRTVTVTDANGCPATASLTVTENILPLTANIEQTATINCAGGSEAALQVNVAGGKGPFQFQWNDPALTGQTPINVAAGSYEVSIVDAAGTSIVSEISVPDASPLTATITPVAPASTGNADGKANVLPKGGTAPYTFAWDNGETIENAVALAPGTRSVTITDANGCETTAAIEVVENILPLTVSIEQTSVVRCAGGNDAALQVTVAGGKGPYQFIWNDENLTGQAPTGIAAGAYQVTIADDAGNEMTTEISVADAEPLSATINPVAPASTDNADGKAAAVIKGGTAPYTITWDNGETTENAVALAPGTRSVTVTDANRCETIATIEITEDILPLVVAIEQTAPISCAGENNGALQVQVNGGKGPYQFQWSDPALGGQAPVSVAAGTYELTVVDALGTTMNREITVAEPQALTAIIEDFSPANTGQSDGQASVKVNGGSGNYTYSWDTGEAGQALTTLSPGAHSVTVTDANGCVAIADVEITEDIKPLAVNLEQTAAIKCAGEETAALKAGISGGKGPFELKWNDPGLSGEEISGLPPGDYQLTVTDASGQSQTAAIQISAPEALSAEIAGKKPATTDRSEDGRASLLVKGGSGDYSFQWDNGENTVNAEALPVGTHSVTVTDGNGCSAVASVEIAEKIIKELSAGRVRSGQTINIQKLQFEADSTQIDPSSIPVLDEIYEFLNENPSIQVEVGGHTNSLPPPEYCDQLSTARAKAVAEYLVSKGIDPDRVTYVGYGKRNPIFSNQTEDGRRRNQRVEIKILRM